eukprot:snap_masked-scaffold_4-processed-gene-21.25-mRNA-1 protein AED:1.00 eAED:1.00 QI:0/0/0/0/1/1/2/0/66
MDLHNRTYKKLLESLGLVHLFTMITSGYFYNLSRGFKLGPAKNFPHKEKDMIYDVQKIYLLSCLFP